MFEKPFAAVFISDLHLHPAEPSLLARFNDFVEWAASQTDTLYILGDFFHAWPGDDDRTPWSEAIAARLKGLAEQGVAIYYLHGNRDFLLGQQFARSANMTILAEPTVISIEGQKLLLVHGDRYCIHDKSHQWFRKLTRNRWFASFFLRLPLSFRLKIVSQVRMHSQTNRRKTAAQMDVVIKPMLHHMQQKQVSILIHGHTHKPGLSNHWYNEKNYQQYVLSDWDDKPHLLCYHKSKGLKFSQYSF